MSASERYDVGKLEIFKTRYKGEAKDRWGVWYYGDDGYATIYSNTEWECKEDVELAMLKEMLDGKL